MNNAITRGAHYIGLHHLALRVDRATSADTMSPFHAGERDVQERVGVREVIEPWARQVVRPFLPQQHRDFYRQLPFVVVAARDAEQRPWVTLLAGAPGFIGSPDAGTLNVTARPLEGDALEGALRVGADVGMLGIELDTRRRNRVNGTISEIDSRGMRFEVGQAFGNCPQYITEREWRAVDVDPLHTTTSAHDRLDSAMQDWIRTADTFFIASGYRGDGVSDTYGMDASHRGGPAGFVRVVDDRRLVFPDYAGNNHFNTIGNLVMDSRVGILFVDFESGGLLQISGTASIDWDSAEVGEYPGAKRLVNIHIDAVVRLDGVLPIRWGEPQGSIRSLRLVEKRKESADVTSFLFTPRDDGELPEFQAGQHLPIEIAIDGVTHDRTYSLSNGPGQGYYRISVKREPLGTVSRYLHDSLETGAIVSSRKPQGDFVVADNHRPVALISGGIGVTPMISMLHSLAGTDRAVYFIHGARDGAHHPLRDEVRQIAGTSENIEALIAYSRPSASDVAGEEPDHSGRVTGELIMEALPDLDAEFYLCGPMRFLADIREQLRGLGVAADRIQTETF